jgi:hypothetical protein
MAADFQPKETNQERIKVMSQQLLPHGDYRLKPEPPKPREIWVNEYFGVAAGFAYTSEYRAKAAHGTRSNVRIVKFVEVLE